jgi:putative transposase
VLQLDRSSVRYWSRRCDGAEPRGVIKRVSREGQRFGCRRVQVMVAREALSSSKTRVRAFIPKNSHRCAAEAAGSVLCTVKPMAQINAAASIACLMR